MVPTAGAHTGGQAVRLVGGRGERSACARLTRVRADRKERAGGAGCLAVAGREAGGAACARRTALARRHHELGVALADRDARALVRNGVARGTRGDLADVVVRARRVDQNRPPHTFIPTEYLHVCLPAAFKPNHDLENKLTIVQVLFFIMF